MIRSGLEQKGPERGQRVLKELNNNVLSSTFGPKPLKIQGGTWKRRNCAPDKQKKGDQCVELGSAEDRDRLGAKRWLSLVNEEENVEEDNQSGKKIKLGEAAMIMKEASHNWPQLDQ